MNNVYESPLSSRYASKEMLYNFSSDMKFSTWRRLWVSLAKAEMALGLPITQEQVDEMEAHITDIDYDVARQREKEVRHDVMAHVYTFGKVAPKAAGIIHLGATSAYVGDNTDIIQIREGLLLVRKKLATVLDKLAQFADAHKAQPTLGFTHFQPAQLTTVGKRATLWMNELLMDLGEVEYRIENLRMLGSKGTTGTQASFMELFDGDESKVKELEKRIADDFGFAGVVPVSGQTYSRKIDAQTLATLAGIAESASKFATDLRLLQHLKEVEEPFEKNQIGSSAMPYKRNPMRSERICALARYVIADSLEPGVHLRDPVVRAHARRLREQAHLGSRSVPRGRRYPRHYDQRRFRPCRLPQGHRGACDERAALHGHREHHDGRGKARRQPSGAA